jgi:hypothetical protein
MAQTDVSALQLYLQIGGFSCVQVGRQDALQSKTILLYEEVLQIFLVKILSLQSSNILVHFSN